MLFKQLYFEHYKPLYRFIVLRTNSDEAAKDLTQDVFMRLWRNRKKLKIRTSLRAYLYRAAANAVIDFHRRKSRERQYLSGLARDEMGAVDDNLELRTSLLMAIDNLPEDIRLAYTLSRYDGLKSAEIAEVCGVAIRTIEYRLQRAREQLREQLL